MRARERCKPRKKGKTDASVGWIVDPCGIVKAARLVVVADRIIAWLGRAACRRSVRASAARSGMDKKGGARDSMDKKDDGQGMV